jgi:NNP family nitrate/nitrite transporter-like MFS transporter
VALYAFLGPLLGSAVRPFGGWLSDKFGGAVVTQFTIGVMTGVSIGKKKKKLKSQEP